MNIKETFLGLTGRTYPHGTESDLDHLLTELEFDEFGNRFIQIGESTCMFTSHLDTATSANTEIIHVIENNIIKTDGKTILGADDKAGVTIMFHMIENKIPGLYYFFLGEEVGCVGSKKLAEKIRGLKATETIAEWDKIFKKITKVVSFDRRGTTSLITYQASQRCASDEFAQAISDELNKHEITFAYKPDPTGIYTDSAQFTKIYPECTNISVGYKSEHCFIEQQDIDHLDKLAKACLLVDWENLPIKRDPAAIDYNYGRYYDNEWDDYGYGYGYSNRQHLLDNSSTAGKFTTYEEKIHFFDEEYNYVSTIIRGKYTAKLTSVDFSKERIEDERTPIIDLLNSLEVDYDSVKWDGFKLIVKHNLPSGHTTECNREELSEFLPELNFWKKLSEEDYKEASTWGSFDKVY